MDKFFIAECKFDKNPILKDYPEFLPKILDSLYQNRKAFTTHDSHPKYLEEVGNCKFFKYHPQLIPGHENHIFSCPVTKMDVQSEQNLLRILLKWERTNILAKQDIRADAMPSHHIHNSSSTPPEASEAPLPMQQLQPHLQPHPQPAQLTQPVRHLQSQPAQPPQQVQPRPTQPPQQV